MPLLATQGEFKIREIQEKDNSAIAGVIRDVSAEFGLTGNSGFSVADPTLEQMYSNYAADNAYYWVVEYQGQVVGGAGLAPLKGQTQICELQKMYFLPQCRGKGLAQQIISLALKKARELNFKQCYIETTACLKKAIKLYERQGFEYITHPLGDTGHCACEIRMLKNL